MLGFQCWPRYTRSLRRHPKELAKSSMNSFFNTLATSLYRNDCAHNFVWIRCWWSGGVWKGVLYVGEFLIGQCVLYVGEFWIGQYSKF